MKKKINLSVVLILSLILLQGCAPEIRFGDSGEFKAYSPVNLSMNIDNARPFAPEHLSVHLFRKYNMERNFPISVTQSQKQKNHFDLKTNGLAPGPYRLIAEVTYQREFLGIRFGKARKLIYHDFQIHARLPETCFNFSDKEQDLKGWESPGVYIENKDKPFKAPPCPGLFHVHNDWPYELDTTTRGGSIFIPVSNECFPRSTNQQSRQARWRFSLKSPRLSELTHWQNIRTIHFRVATSSLPIRIIPEIHYQHAGKTLSSNMPNNPKHVYDVSMQNWSVLEHPTSLPNGAVIDRLEFHVYGLPEQTVGNGVKSIYFDGICPSGESFGTSN